jgi:hypothetical protein
MEIEEAAKVGELVIVAHKHLVRFLKVINLQITKTGEAKIM